MFSKALTMGLLGSTLFAATASAQTTLHYWDFSTQNDAVGGVAAAVVGTPDLSQHALYGEAYPGSGPSFNTVVSALGSGGGGVLDADIWDGSAATAMDFGNSDFSFSYWSYDDLATDGDGRGPRIFDNLGAGLTEGIQLGTDLPGNYNLRIDDDSSGSVLSNTTETLYQPTDVWTHIAVNVDRANTTVTVYVNGVSAISYSIAALSGGIGPSQDLRIGAINLANSAGGSQNGGLDDLAFYDGLLNATQLAGLAAGTMTPLDLAPSGGVTTFCDPASNNSTGAPAVLAGTWGTGVGSDLHLEITGGVPGQLAYFLVGNEATSGVAISNGLFCLVGTSTAQFFRYNVGGTDMNSIGGFDASGTMINAAGTSTTGFGFDVPSTIPSGPPATIVAGDTWHFQGWYRDTPSGAGDSNFTNGLSVTF